MVASICLWLASLVAVPNSIAIITTKGCVEDDLMVLKLAWNIARTLNVCLWKTPTSRRRCSGSDISWDSTTWEVPDTNKVGRPLHSINTTTDAVKTAAKAVGSVGS